MKIAFFEIEEWEIPYLKKKLQGHDLIFEKGELREDSVQKYADVELVSVFIYSTVNKVVLEKMPKLKFVTTRSMGFDHIDIDYCKRTGIVACNVPTYGANTVAEHAFALLMNLSRKIIQSVERTRRGNFEVDGLRGFDLFDKTIGVIGLGHIGSQVVKIAKGFGMKVVVYTRHPDETLAKKLGVTFLSLNELLAASDVITLHIPHSKETHHIINNKNVKKCKKGSILINTARGGLVDTEAILYGLNNEIFAAAGLDVLEEECGIKEEIELLTGQFIQACDLRTQLYNHVLINKENVIVTPHNAFNSNEALQTILRVTTDNILGFLNKTPVNTIGQ